MTTKTRRKRIVKPVIRVKPTELIKPNLPDKPTKDEFISTPVSPDAITSCDGCHFYDEAESECNDKENRDCTGLIFVKK